VTSGVILDTGPLVAIIDQDEQHHDWAISQLQTIAPPLLTCDAVLAEACYLLRKHPTAIKQIESYCSTGVLTSCYSAGDDLESVFALMRKYRDAPMSFADACLVRIIETGAGRIVFTLDGHFKIYRQKGRRRIDTIAPD